jgi:hypothetical protein
MLNKYSKVTAHTEEPKIRPSHKTLKMLLNYSKSVEMKHLKTGKVLLRLN